MLDDRGTGRTAWVLVCEDDDELGERVAQGLRDAGFTVDLTRNLAEACRHCGARLYDCLIVDRGLPDGDGLDLVRRQRESGDHTPALLISARDSPAIRTEGYAGGADDYLAKPFSLGELATRVRALCQRRAQAPSPILTIGDLVVDRVRRRVQRGGVLLIMTMREFAALELLTARPGSLVTRGELAEYCNEPSPVAVDDLMTRLERKLGAPKLIHPAAAGYRLHV
ncbi:response regulator transcription factor [Nocardia yamanashiensis]|uniref:response regulator transcription factor n=1 Tax=Nocardia yamanashiensis TaxID=209247 RepID=UPI001E618041|nr:response regulator transcription factor [Nocardia yamanashiensis]UGT41079.1 response regulator transcription factor [Nocardia yamanashiensis]